LGGSFAQDRGFKNRNVKNSTMDWFQMQVEAKARAIAYLIKSTFIDGDDVGSPQEAKGLKQWIDANDSATNDIKVQFAENANGKKISAATILECVSSLDKLMNATLGVPDMFLSNRTNMDNLANKALTTAANNALAQVFMPAQITFNNVTTMGYKYRGIPMIDMGLKVDNTAVLPFTETLGGGTTCSSIYAVKFGPEWVLPLMDEPIEVITEQERPGFHTDVEQRIAFAFKQRRAAARLEGILAE
jgi:hypothetical protein